VEMVNVAVHPEITNDRLEKNKNDGGTPGPTGTLLGNCLR
jgi:hypothetical protein